ncbi:MAG: FAD-dependent oxidoreductase, partial [Phycisphaerae bacterium]|nr:FAD-dependent oxidoreductase [Phycisphaerae bacterium]
MSEKQRIVIVGGVAGGASAAARLRRLSEDAEIILFERGDYISFANCGLPYHIGGVIPERKRLLVQTPQSFKNRFNVDVRVHSEVTSIDRVLKEVTVTDRKTDRVYTERYDSLILSPGAEPVKPPIPGLDNDNVLTLRNMADMDAIKKIVDCNALSHAVVVGGGYIGLEMAEALRERNIDVTLVELADQVFNVIDPEMAVAVQQQLQLHGIKLYLKTSVDSVEQEGGVLHVQLSTGETIQAGLMVMAIGVKPETTLAKKAGLEIGERGGISVNERMQTTDPAIYAVGDAVEVNDFVGGFKSLVPLAGPANRQGRIAADHIFDRASVYRDTQGTGICKVFDIAVGMTGLSEKMLGRMGIPYEKIYIHPASHAGYYPGAAQISLKLLFDPESGKILGAQATGAGGVDKRIDILAVAIRAGLTVHDLKDLELCYAPPFGSAKDPVNYAGFVASNVINGDVSVCHVEDVVGANGDIIILDVRTSAEVMGGTIAGAVNIPLDDLRGRLGELDKNKEILVYCQVGLRGYLACRILTQNGYQCRNLTGGYKTYKATLAAQSPSGPDLVPTMEASSREITSDSGEVDERSKTINTESQATLVKTIDACGLQCPGPVMEINNEMANLQPGESLTVVADDPGFAADIPAWCQSTGHKLTHLTPQAGGKYAATIVKRPPAACPALAESSQAVKQKTMVVFSGDFDKLMASFIIANGAAAMGSKVTMFFTFWGLNALRKSNPPSMKKTFIERMFGLMMPRGADKLTMSQMNMGGMGLAMIKG